jgi:hypothetical protein
VDWFFNVSIAVPVQSGILFSTSDGKYPNTMPLAETVCTILTYGGQVLPYGDTVSGLAAALGVLSYIAVLLPLEIELVPVIGGFISGYELHKHKLFMGLLLYLTASFAVTTGVLPIC